MFFNRASLRLYAALEKSFGPRLAKIFQAAMFEPLRDLKRRARE